MRRFSRSLATRADIVEDNRRERSSASQGGPLTVTNAQKLALTGISVGQVVHVTDGFVVSGAPDGLNGFWYRSFFGSGQAAIYSLVGQSPDFVFCYYSYFDQNNPNPATDGWILENDDTSAFVQALNNDVSDPWLASWGGGVTLTHPAVQTYLGGDPSNETSWSP